MAEWPAKITPELEEVLGLPIFVTAPIAHGFQAAGEPVATKVEAEQAFVLFWLIGLVLEHGPDWKRVAGERLIELGIQIRELREHGDG